MRETTRAPLYCKRTVCPAEGNPLVYDGLLTTVEDFRSMSGTYDDFIAALPPDACRYAVYDFEYEKPGEGTRNKICFFAWSPDIAKVKPKMVYAASKDAIRKKLDAIATEIQGTDPSEVAYEAVLEKVSRASQ
ncbi:MAG: hypothetical protein BJ554DRAFT_3309 [Olpidium bornovanus]|uniref:Cofilin n=1 Tax=Olpidium bornovanus TaxID=278681 RepID=A0A8H7ZNY5_9FUNG|nr:MAG: hypothetical protein BJ554DRAFT_3309 [Olpidium bornovanus]